MRASVRHVGPVYILWEERPSRRFPAGSTFEIGQGQHCSCGRHPRARDSSSSVTLNFDVSFIACGVMVKECLDAAHILEAQGIRASVDGLASVKHLDADLCFALARRSRLVVAAV